MIYKWRPSGWQRFCQGLGRRCGGTARAGGSWRWQINPWQPKQRGVVIPLLGRVIDPCVFLSLALYPSLFVSLSSFHVAVVVLSLLFSLSLILPCTL